MALFRKTDSNQNNYFTTATIITEGTNCIGGFIGEDSIHIDGNIHGDVKVNNVVIIGKQGFVKGNIKAKQVISSGTCDGNILCDSLELMETSKTISHIKSNKILAKGKFKGNITCSGLFVHSSAHIDANIQARTVVAGGTLFGIVACKELKITQTGFIKGKMFADRIFNQGGHVEGFIGKYSELVAQNPQLSRYADIFNARHETVLLEQADYHVDVEQEIQKKSATSEDDDYIDVDLDMQDEPDLYALG